MPFTDESMYIFERFTHDKEKVLGYAQYREGLAFLFIKQKKLPH